MLIAVMIPSPFAITITYFLAYVKLLFIILILIFISYDNFTFIFFKTSHQAYFSKMCKLRVVNQFLSSRIPYSQASEEILTLLPWHTKSTLVFIFYLLKCRVLPCFGDFCVLAKIYIKSA